MSIAAIPALVSSSAPAHAAGQSLPGIRRRPSQQQGVALEMLGHAIEYLMDSRIYAGEEHPSDAMQLLAAASRRVFLECAVVEPLHVRLRRRWARTTDTLH